MVVPGPSSDADKELLKSSCEVLRKDDSVHLVKDIQSGLVGASVFEAGTVDNVILQASQSVMIYALEGDRLSISVANPDLALYAGASDEVFDENGKRVERSIYGRDWVNNPAAETSVTFVLNGEWKLEDHICGGGLECYESFIPTVTVSDGKTTVTVKTKECRTEELRFRKI